MWSRGSVLNGVMVLPAARRPAVPDPPCMLPEQLSALLAAGRAARTGRGARGGPGEAWGVPPFTVTCVRQRWPRSGSAALQVRVLKGARCPRVVPTARPRREARRTGAHLAGNFNQISDLELVFGFTNAIRESNCINHNHIILPIIKFPLTQLFTLPLLIN